MLWCVIERQRKNNNNKTKQTTENKKSALQGLHTEQWARDNISTLFSENVFARTLFLSGKSFVFYLLGMRLNFLNFFQELETGMFIEHFLLLTIETRCFTVNHLETTTTLKRYIYLLFQCKFFFNTKVN